MEKVSRLPSTLVYGLPILIAGTVYGKASGVFAAENQQFGAFIERPSSQTPQLHTFLVPADADLVCITQNEDVYKAVRANQTGKIITAIIPPDTNDTNIACFYGDGSGLSSRVSVAFSQINTDILLPPTIYGLPNINGQYGTLGFVGKGYPLSRVNVEITLSTNEKRIYETLANQRGEWQITPPKLPPGKHKARAKISTPEVESQWSQDIQIQVLQVADQLIQDLGSGTRRSIENVVENLPSPVRRAAKQIDEQSEFITKYILPTIFTLTTITQSGILAQNLLYLVFQTMLAVGQAFGIVKKKQPMGIIYDAITKRPIGRAIVRLYEAGTNRLIETDVTSAAGVFSFMPPEGFYYIKASKPGYEFPSKLVLSKRDGRYSPIYTGNDIRVTSGEAVVNVAVPMDPVAYEEMWTKQLVRQMQRWYEPLNQWLIWVGMFLAFLSYTRQPNRLNFVILWLYGFGLAYFWWQGRSLRRDFGVVLNKQGKPMSGIELILTDVEYNRLVSRRVTDEKGRYQFIAPPGNYQIRIISTGWELVKTAKRTYQGDELKIEGERGQTRHLIPKIVIQEAGRG